MSEKSSRIVKGTSIVVLGLVSVAVSAITLQYYVSNVTVDNAVINGHSVRLASPVDGQIKKFYVQPGVAVRSGEVLARIATAPLLINASSESAATLASSLQEQKNIADLRASVDGDKAQLDAAQKAIVAFQGRLKHVDEQYKSVKATNTLVLSDVVKQQQAALRVEQTEEAKARREYARYQGLVLQGAIPRQVADQARSTWEASVAKVQQARASLSQSLTNLHASGPEEVIGSNYLLREDRAQLLQSMEEKMVLSALLKARVDANTISLRQAQAAYVRDQAFYQDSHRIYQASQKLSQQNQNHDLQASFDGIVYQTQHEQGEQVKSSEPLVTLVDCNDVWLEKVVGADQASTIDTHAPVDVQLTGFSSTLVGKVDLISPMTGIQTTNERSTGVRVQALDTFIPPNLVGMPLARVTVRLTQPPVQLKSEKFCGLGQTAKLAFARKKLF